MNMNMKIEMRINVSYDQLSTMIDDDKFEM